MKTTVSCSSMNLLYRSYPVACLQLSGTSLINYPLSTSSLTLSSPPIHLPLIKTAGQVGHFEQCLTQFLIFSSSMMSQYVYSIPLFLNIYRIVDVNPHLGFSGVPLINTMNGQLSTNDFTFGCHKAMSFLNWAEYSGESFSSASKIAPMSLPSNLCRIFLSV